MSCPFQFLHRTWVCGMGVEVVGWVGGWLGGLHWPMGPENPRRLIRVSSSASCKSGSLPTRHRQTTRASHCRHVHIVREPGFFHFDTASPVSPSLRSSPSSELFQHFTTGQAVLIVQTPTASCAVISLVPTLHTELEASSLSACASSDPLSDLCHLWSDQSTPRRTQNGGQWNRMLGCSFDWRI